MALSPLAVPPPDLAMVPHVASAAVQLAANPFEIYENAITEALQDAGTVLEQLADAVGATLSVSFLEFLSEEVTQNVDALSAFLQRESLQAYFDGLPGKWDTYSTALNTFFTQLQAKIETQVPAAFETAFALLAEGDIEGAVNEILELPYGLTGTSVFSVLLQTRNFLNYLLPFPAATGLINGGLDSFPVLKAALGLIGPGINFLGASASALQDVVDAAEAGDAEALVNALVSGPGMVIDGVLNGGYGPSLPLFGSYPGIFTPEGNSLQPNGTIAGLVALAENVLKKLGWNPTTTATTSTAGVSDTSLTAATTLTLDIAGTAEAAPSALKMMSAEPVVKSKDATTQVNSSDADTGTTEVTETTDTAAGTQEAAPKAEAASGAVVKPKKLKLGNKFSPGSAGSEGAARPGKPARGDAGAASLSASKSSDTAGKGAGSKRDRSGSKAR